MRRDKPAFFVFDLGTYTEWKSSKCSLDGFPTSRPVCHALLVRFGYFFTSPGFFLAYKSGILSHLIPPPRRKVAPQVRCNNNDRYWYFFCKIRHKKAKFWKRPASSPNSQSCISTKNVCIIAPRVKSSWHQYLGSSVWLRSVCVQ